MVDRITNRYLLLLVILLTMFVLHPFTTGDTAVRIVLPAFGLVMVFAALRAAGLKRRWVLAVGAVGLASYLIRLVSLGNDRIELGAVSCSLSMMFILVVAVTILAQVLRSQRVTMDTVLGAACVYLFMGLLWGRVFVLVELLSPGSFSFAPALGELGNPEESQLAYYSFITLTTVGYGDVTPLSPPARVFAMLEGLLGQLYIAIIIARLVALQVTNSLQGSGSSNS